MRVTINQRHPEMNMGQLVLIRHRYNQLADDYAPWWAWPVYWMFERGLDMKWSVYNALWRVGFWEPTEGAVTSWRDFSPYPRRGRRRERPYS